jgi:hypothetical protein
VKAVESGTGLGVKTGKIPPLSGYPTLNSKRCRDGFSSSQDYVFELALGIEFYLV